MAKAQNPRQEPKPEDIEKERLFFERYFKSPEYLRKLKEQGYENPEKIIAERLKNVSSVSSSVGKVSEYIPTEHKLTIDPGDLASDGSGSDGTKPHELSHAAYGNFNPIANWFNSAKMNSNDISAINKRNKATEDHDKDPYEFKADMDSLRYILRKDKVYDASTQKFDKNTINTIRKKYLEDNNQNYDLIQRLFDNVKSDDDLIYLMNKVASNKPNDNTEVMAKYGAKIKYQDGGGIDPFSSSYALQPAKAAPTMIDIQDTRKLNPVTGKALTDKQKKSVKVNQDYITDIIGQAKAAGIDPYTALAVSYQESGFGNGDKLFNLNPQVFGKPFGNAEEGMKSLQDMFKYAKNLQGRGVVPQGEEFLLQGNNGYGKIKKGHADLEGSNSIYGMPIPDEGIDFKKNPYYGRTVLSLRDEILKNNKSISDLIQNTPAMKKPIKKYALGGEVDSIDTANAVTTGDPNKPVYSPAEQKIVDQYTKLGYNVTRGTDGQLKFQKNPGVGAAPVVQQQQQAQQPLQQTAQQATPKPVQQPTRQVVTKSGDTIPLPDYNNPKSRLDYATAFRNKYGKDVLKGYGDIPLRVNEKPIYGTRTSKEAAIQEATALGLNPALFYASAMIEGQSGIYAGSSKTADGQPAWTGYTGDKDYPISGVWGFGLDSFQDYYPELKKKGYLPKDFDSQWKNYEFEGAPEGSTSPSGEESTMFKTTDAGIKAKAAMMRAFYDESDAYAKKKGYNLTPEQRDYFALAHFNSGAHGYEMMDAYNKAGILKNNDFINSGSIPNVNVPFMFKGKQMSAGASQKLHQQIYGNISPRIAAARGLQAEGLFEYGGEVPKAPKGVAKYANGGSINDPGKGKKTKGRIDNAPPIPFPNEKGFVAPGELSGVVDDGFIMPIGRVDDAPPMPFNNRQGFIRPGQRTGIVDSGFAMPSGQVDSGFLMPGQTQFGGPMGQVDEGFAMPIMANTKLRGVRQFAQGGDISETGPGDEAPKYSDQENYYRSSAKLSYYKDILNSKLKAKNPQGFSDYFKNLLPLRIAGKTADANKYIQDSKWNDYLSTDEVKKNLGGDYQDYLDSIQSVNNYNKAQGLQPLYGDLEGEGDISNLNYGRRFASLTLTPSVSVDNIKSGNHYSREYAYDPKTKQVSFKENGDTKLRPSYLTAPQMKRGGKIPKYANGTGDPIPGVFNPTGNKAGNNWQAENNPVPINPDADPNQQIFALNQNQPQGYVGGIKPLSEFYEATGNPNGQQKFTGTGRYLDSNGNTTNIQEQQSLADQLSSQNRNNAMASDRRMDNIEGVATTGMAAINTYFAKQQAGQLDRTNRRKAIMQQVEARTVNPYAEGTGSQAIMKVGGKMKKYADGGEMQDPSQQMKVIDGGRVEQLSSSDHSNPMFEFKGKTHAEGGIGLQYGNSLAEVEKDEVGWVDQQGDLNIFGKLKLPGTNQTFKKAAQDIGAQEKKIDGKKSKYLNTLTNANEADPYQESAKSTAKVMFKSLDKQSKQIAEKKEALASYQNLILSMADQMSSQMKYGGQMPIMAEGGEVGPDDPIVTVPLKKDFAKGERNLKNIKGIVLHKTAGDGDARSVVNGWDNDNRQASADYIIDKDGTITQVGDLSDTKWHSGRKSINKTTLGVELVGSAADESDMTDAQYKALARLQKDVFAPLGITANNYYGHTQVNKKKGFDFANDSSIANVLKKAGISDKYTPVKDLIDPLYSGNISNLPDDNTGTADDPQTFTRVYNGNYTPPNEVNTPYGKAKRQATSFNGKVNIGNGDRQRGAVSPLAIEQIAPELLGIATNRREPVYQLGYQPDLQQTFDISYQLGRNENQSTFNQLSQIAEQNGNYEALSQLAAQKYQADQQYNMQEIQSNAQQKLGVYNQNTNTLNDAKVKNLALIADQQQKQTQAKSNTRQEDLAAFKSISGKVLQNQLENKNYNAYANLFQHYGFDKSGNVTFNPDKVTKRFSSGEAQQFGMMAAQQGASAIMNGDFSRQFTKVKNNDGSTTTTETLGQNKKIQEEYSTLKKQGFDDALIGNILKAKYPETISND
jgi:hypothetical protein